MVTKEVTTITTTTKGDSKPKVQQVKKVQIVKKQKKKRAPTNNNNQLLIQNFLETQKVLVTLSIKIENLTTNIDRMFKLFEASAETLMKKEFASGGQENKVILDEIEKIKDQTKLIAKGVTLIHGEIENPESPYTQLYPKAPKQMPAQQPVQTPQFQAPIMPALNVPKQPSAYPEFSNNEYQQSISQIEKQKEQAPSPPAPPFNFRPQQNA